MAYQTLLAHLSHETVVAPVLSAATLLADRHSAHLVGAHVQPPVDVYISEVPMPLEINQHFVEQQEARAAKIKALFDKKTESQNYPAEWRVVDTMMESVTRSLVEQANTADLLVVSQSEGEFSDPRFRNLPEHLLMACGRPVLVVPVGEPPDSLGERVLVAWDGRRESTRALFGALPMLRLAAEVRLHRINAPYQDRHHYSGITEELANTLARHGVALEVCHSDARGSEIADELLGFARDMDADTLVMGCYGHSPFREFILGGTTRKILANAHVPVLMSN